MTGDLGRPDFFGGSEERPDRAQVAAQYQNRSMHKLHIAEWHRAEFERLENELTTDAFVELEGEPFLPAQAHADAALIQLAAAFDAFACAVAHRYEVANADQASFGGDRWNARLVESAESELADRIGSVGQDSLFRELTFYRNMAAHRGVVGEQQRGGSVDEVGDEGVRYMLPDWLPLEAPDHPGFSVRPVLDRYLKWGRPVVAGLNSLAVAVWNLEDESEGELILRDEMFLERTPDTDEESGGTPQPSGRIHAVMPEDLAPRYGEWHVWFEWGSHTFGGSTVPPTWFARRGDGERLVLVAHDIDVDELRAWIEDLTDANTAKAVLWHFRPEQTPTDSGRVLAPRLGRL